MTRNSRTVAATPDQVWDVLSDGWLYPVWVVGATRMRDVDATWPGIGAQLHHSVGVWPLVLSDSTEVLDSQPPRSLRLRARAWPLGEAEVLLTLTAQGAETLVEIEEDVVSGPGAMVPTVLRAQAVKVRNVETLRRLAFIAEHRAAG
ncbi:MAG: SRPBCC family protein [Nocardioidaceae bacterium]|nr:SRPBCC family protein [Nocardioidaceae bacterium]NUS50577.1 SRPBCC family protein [Nocardioidaceae bacterium]